MTEAERSMFNKAALKVSVFSLIASTTFAQTPTTPPPWFNETKQVEKQKIITFDTSSDKQAPQETTTKSRLEEHYQERTANESLLQFGYDLLHSNNKEQNTNILYGAVQDNYRLGPGDKLTISFTGQRNDQITTMVTPQGQIIIKDLPPLPATGRSLAELREAISRFTDNIPNTKAFISLSEIKQIGVLIIGPVQRPGKKTLNAFNTVFDALQVAGGIQKQGSLRQIKLIRGGVTTTIDLYELFMSGAAGKDISLKDGDRIIVPPIGKTLAVTGAVKRPGIYELKTNTSKISLSRVLKYAGGILSPGQNIFLKQSPTKTGTEQIDQVSNFNIPQFSDGMVLNVQRGTDIQTGSIKLSGHTNREGFYDHKKTPYLSDLLKIEGALSADIYPLIGIIKRQDKELLTTRIISFSPQIVSNKKRDIKLYEKDEIILFSNKEIKEIFEENHIETKSIEKNEKDESLDKEITELLIENSLSIKGAVRAEGSYPVASHTPLNIILSAANGTTRIADLSNIEITSASPDTNEVFRTTININPLQNEYTNPEEVTLSPGDTIRINQQQKAIKNNTVTIIGEVLNPGEYDLLPGDNVSSLLRRAGGLTDQAYPIGGIFSRESARKTEELRYRNTARDLERRLANAIQNDSKKAPNETQISMVRDLSAQLSTIQAIGRITVELNPDILEVSPELDMLLENGDKIYIPQRPLTVRVAGEVFSPAALQFRSKKDPRDYINEAGGFTKAADKNRTFVIFPNGSAKPLKVNAWNHDPIMIPPGSTIVVPLDPKPFNFLHSAKEIGQIIGNLAVTAVFIDDIRD